MADFRATYRLQLGPGCASRRAARARALPPRPRRLAPVPVALVPGAGGLRRTATTSSTRARSRTCSAATRGFRALAAAARDGGPGHRCSTSSPTTWRPTTRTRSGPTRRLRARFFDLDRGDRPPPALLRHRPPGRRAPGGSRGVRDDARAGARRSCARAWSTACASTTPTGSPTPRSTSSGCATAGAAHVWVEKILDPGEQLRDWPVEGTVGYEFLNDVAALFVDPAGEAPLTALWAEVSGDARPFGEVAAEAKLEQAHDHVRAGGRAAARGVHGPRRRRARGSPPLPVYRTYIRGEPARARTCAVAARRRRTRWLAGRRAGRVRHALPADARRR